MSVPGAVSVIIRARDEAAALTGCLDALRAQSGAPELEVIYVDLGSGDGSAQLAAARGATVLALDAFSFGEALNRGADQAAHEILVALSAHVVLPHAGWLARAIHALEADSALACASGDVYGPDGEPLREPVRQDAALARRRPEWGYANGAGAFRARLWRERPFRADLPGCEDKEWALHWLDRGYGCLIDPELAVVHDHTHDPLRAIYGRARREAQGYAAFLDRGPQSAAQLARTWWSDRRFYDSALRARLSPRRAARLLGDHAGRRASARIASGD
ncbi:MAG TPA: glycosyltransferase family 2 protein [Solirubrobacteraceae bacterium]|nr:glycosyltransferase family 2 protein [Solirubrobacteraceae bacterium]